MGNKTKASAAGSTGCTGCHCCCCGTNSTITEIKQPDRRRNEADGFLRVPEFAQLVGLPEVAVRELIKSQRLTIHKVGRSVYIPVLRRLASSARVSVRPAARSRITASSSEGRAMRGAGRCLRPSLHAKGFVRAERCRALGNVGPGPAPQQAPPSFVADEPLCFVPRRALHVCQALAGSDPDLRRPIRVLRAVSVDSLTDLVLALL